MLSHAGMAASPTKAGLPFPKAPHAGTPVC